MDITLPPDFKEFLRLLNTHGVEYLLIGGYAVGYHGYPRATNDMDIWIHQWHIACVNKAYTNYKLNYCIISKGQLAIYYDIDGHAGTREQSNAKEKLGKLRMGLHIGGYPEIVSLTIDNNTPFFAKSGSERYEYDANQLTNILPQILKGKIAKIHAKAKTGEIKDAVIHLENFSEAYAAFEHTYNEWFK